MRQHFIPGIIKKVYFKHSVFEMLCYGSYNTYMQIKIPNLYAKTQFHSQEVDNIKLFLANIFNIIWARCTYLYCTAVSTYII